MTGGAGTNPGGLQMAVTCRGCGREYDVALFEFGRTLCCACGQRVGIEPRVRRMASSAEMRFAADAMLGRLARWLRLLGFDCVHDPEMRDRDIVRLALSDGRTILTRDRRLPEEWWIHQIYLVREAELEQQLLELFRRFDLASSLRVLTRCSECNRPLHRIGAAEASQRVPSRLLEVQRDFSECPGCGRVYWEGSHAARIRRLAERLVAAG